MLLIKSPSTDPYFNIASEEYLLKRYSEDVFLLYINEPSIIIGKHQNTLEEINLDFVRQNSIKVVRRLSGGGTVYHDFGNLNFTFIINGEDKNLIDFQKHTTPIIEALRELEVDARFEGRNDIRIQGKKVSGNAEHIFKKRVLHHGTLLFNSELDRLSEAINVQAGVYKSKAVKSVRSVVANIKDYMSQDISMEQFTDHIISYIKRTHPDYTLYELSDFDRAQISDLIQTKYTSWSWNFGYSPNYQLSRSLVSNGVVFNIEMLINSGIITEISIKLDNEPQYPQQELFNNLFGERHTLEAIHKKFHSVKIESYFSDLTIDKIISGLI